MRTYLDVPFGEKNQAVELGAKWDMSAKSWYVPDGVDLYPFMKWVNGIPKLSKGVKRALKRGRGKR